MQSHLSGSGASAAGFDSATAQHLRECELCRHWQFDEMLRSELSAAEAPEPRDGFVDELIQTAISRGEQRRVPVPAIAAVAAVAAIAVALLVGNLQGNNEPTDGSYNVTVAPHVAEFVDVVIDSDSGRDAATLTIKLANNLELEGYPNERVISWQTPLTQGKNLLRLPVILMSGSDSQLDVDLSYGTTQKAIKVTVRADAPVNDPVKA
jgi:hypothetical protein